MGDAYLVRRGGGGTALEPLTNPASASDIVLGKEAYGADGVAIVGAYVVSDVHPQLNTVSIAKSNNNLNITNPSTNGNFVDGYKVMSGGEVVKQINSTTLVLTELDASPYVFTVRAIGEGFNDGADSNSLTITVYAFVNGLKDVTSDFDFEKTTSGMTAAFTIVADTGYHLPAAIQIKCNGEDVDFTYNPYTGEVSVSALDTSYSGTVTNGGQLDTPTIGGVDTDVMSVSDVLFAEEYQVNEGSTNYGDVALEASGIINVVAKGVVTPQLMAPKVSVSLGDTLNIVDGYLLEGDVFYAEDYDLYSDGAVVSANIDATADQNAVITYDVIRNFAKSGEYYKSTTGLAANTWALLKVRILTPTATTVRIDYTSYSRASYVYNYLGKLDCEFTDDVNTETSTNYQLAFTTSATNTSYYELAVPAGSHFICFKMRRGSTTSYSDRYLQVKVTEV